MLKKLDIEEKLSLLRDPKINILTKYQLAITLSDTKNERVYYALCELINDNAYLNKRGTFVHCLRNYPPEKSFDLAVDLILNGNFEVSHEAFEIIDHFENKIEGEKVKLNYNKLIGFYNSHKTVRVGV
ncbi:hypothetical protein A6J60_011055 [Psychrobacter sp. FDAARGOS_221]|nr:hypothetical protein A6J60_011055 [Psychrobacter sp. FDAARGOS_221]